MPPYILYTLLYRNEHLKNKLIRMYSNYMVQRCVTEKAQTQKRRGGDFSLETPDINTVFNHSITNPCTSYCYNVEGVGMVEDWS